MIHITRIQECSEMYVASQTLFSLNLLEIGQEGSSSHHNTSNTGLCLAKGNIKRWKKTPLKYELNLI